MTKVAEDLHYSILKLLDENPNLSQRELAQALDLSLGKANYCLKHLIKKGWVKMENFRRQDNKLTYAYILTPSGLTAKACVTRHFLLRKLAEYERLQTDIARLKQEVEAADLEASFSPTANFGFKTPSIND